MKRLFKTSLEFVQWSLSGDAKGKAVHVMVMHDDDCCPNDCRCEPWYEVRTMTPETLCEGARLEADWRKSKSS